jgi:hypothetical protein
LADIDSRLTESPEVGDENLQLDAHLDMSAVKWRNCELEAVIPESSGS